MAPLLTPVVKVEDPNKSKQGAASNRSLPALPDNLQWGNKETDLIFPSLPM